MCEECITAAKQRRASTRRAIHEAPVVEQEHGEDVVYTACHSFLFQAVGLAFMIILGAIAFGLVGPFKGAGPIPAFLFSVIIVSTFMGLMTYVWLWFKMLVSEPVLALASLIVPVALVWRWAFCNKDQTGATIYTHIGASVLGIAAAALLSTNMNLSFGEVRFYAMHFLTPREKVVQLFHAEYGSDYRSFTTVDYGD